MDGREGRPCTAFQGTRRVAAGTPLAVALALKELLRAESAAAGAGELLVFDDESSEPVELDLRGTAAEVRRRLTDPQAGTGSASRAPAGEEDAGAAAAAPSSGPRGRGRPRLGVVAREVTLLPRHWEWLGAQPGGASVTLRRLVEEARRTGAARERVRLARESAFRFMSALAGNEAGFEEAARALFAGDADRFERFTERWPPDVRDHARRLAGRAFDGAEG